MVDSALTKIVADFYSFDYKSDSLFLPDTPNACPRDPKVTMGPIDDLPHTDYTTSRGGQRRNIEVSLTLGTLKCLSPQRDSKLMDCLFPPQVIQEDSL